MLSPTGDARIDMMRRMTIVGLLAGLVLVFAGCSDSGDSDDDSSDTDSDTGGDAATGSGDDSIQTGDPLTASIVLENGDQVAFPVECDLEPHEQAGEQVEFSVVSTGDYTNVLEIIQWAPESFDGMAAVRVQDPETFALLWSAEGTDPVDMELRVDGDTVEGSGLFYEGGDFSGEGVVGQVTATC
jgi:hypothetical protein